jgi:hypothetical protein
MPALTHARRPRLTSCRISSPRPPVGTFRAGHFAVGVQAQELESHHTPCRCCPVIFVSLASPLSSHPSPPPCLCPRCHLLIFASSHDSLPSCPSSSSLLPRHRTPRCFGSTSLTSFLCEDLVTADGWLPCFPICYFPCLRSLSLFFFFFISGTRISELLPRLVPYPSDTLVTANQFTINFLLYYALCQRSLC